MKAVADSPWVREIRITFKAGQELKEHTASQPIPVQVLAGSIDFGVEGKKHRLEQGMLIALVKGVPHDLKAISDGIVRLSLHNTDNQ
ncbi:cupin domain-containing protein [Paraflavitalea pollutisoli]|uniref:cupin domain-containing protein n=1 Tax=Paraflavitalea pollutisoli TaxID=3034143 RepID=UPI0023ED1186|nr:cupin domain-containing protein [Paraflavitalea sp. H1-2-19X]